jgi:adenine-specific DNA-methyltransferase
LTERIGAYGKVNHGGAVSNWEDGRNTPSREQYEKICEALKATGKVPSMPRYEDVVRPFLMDANKQFTDVWDFPSVRPYKGKHPAEKPAEMLEHIIEATSFPGDVVLDCFAGGGSTALAALKLGRYSVSMEIEKQWASAIVSRIENAYELGAVLEPERQERSVPIVTRAEQSKRPQLSLFSASK